MDENTAKDRERRAPNEQTRVIRWADGDYRGQASTKVKSVKNAIWYTGSEAREKIRAYQEGEVFACLFEDACKWDNIDPWVSLKS